MPRTLYSGPAVSVPKHYVGLHTFSYPLGQWGGPVSTPPSFNYGAIRMHDYEWWRNIERSPGVYDWTRLDALAQTNLNRLLILVAFGTPSFHKDPSSPPISRDNYPSWPDAGAWPKLSAIAAFARAACERYKTHPGGIAFEVWNEGTDENYFAGWDTGADAAGWLGKMTRAVYDAVKGVSLSIPVLGVSNVNGEGRAQAYAQACLANGVVPDGVCYHFYGATPGDYAGRIRSIKDAFARGGLTVPIWDTEHGYVGNDIGDSEQAMKELLCIGAVEGVQSFVAFGWENPYDGAANITPGLARGMQWAQDNLAGKNITKIVVEDSGAFTVTAGGVVEPPPPPPPPAGDGGEGIGLLAHIYPSTDFSGVVNDAITGLAHSFADDDLSIVFEGQIEAPASAEYAFRVTADDGVRIRLDGNLVLDEWRQQAPTLFIVPGSFVWGAGEKHSIIVNYNNIQWDGGKGTAILKVEWKYGGTDWHEVGIGRLFPPESVPQPRSCELPWGGSIAHGDSVTAYQSPSVPAGQSCVGEVRTCNDGVLSGSFLYATCVIEPPPADDLASRVAKLESGLLVLDSRYETTRGAVGDLISAYARLSADSTALKTEIVDLSLRVDAIRLALNKAGEELRSGRATAAKLRALGELFKNL